MKLFSLLSCAVGALLLTACTAEKKATSPPGIDEPAPAAFKVKFETSKGDFVVEVVTEWAPLGARRFYNLVNQKFYDDVRFFRVVRNFVVQFGINGDPKVSRFWSNMRILDDPVKQSNRKGYLSFAMAGPTSRTTQVFINLRDNPNLDGMGFAPFGRVVEGMEVVENLYDSYGDAPPRGTGPDQSRIETQGNDYLASQFPRLDYIKTARLMP
jgi:peptidyl-prolyl cis-trans isomerase A (cyclophilin A)